MQMAAPVPIMSFLRPLGLPRPSTVRHFLRFSTSAPRRAATQQPEDRNLVASRTAPESYPPRSMKSLPRPKESRASRRTSHPAKQRQYPTRAPSHHQPTQPKLIPEPVEPLAPEQCAPNLPYFVSRSRNDELPIYTEFKAGGSKRLTRVKNIDGNKSVLRDELRALLGVDAKNAIIGVVTGHIVIKGFHKRPIETYLRQRKF